ncbi:MAG: DNA-processing protein DprA [Nocardioidaceae bacterium]
MRIEPGDLRLGPALARRGPLELADALTRPGHRDLPDAWFARAAADGSVRDQADRLLERADRAGWRWVCPGDPEWPTSLDDLAHAGELNGRGGVPLGLWTRGPLDLAAVPAHAVAVVGARSSTSYGNTQATDLGAELASRAVPVLSGAAYGIDGAAHRGALSARGPTVAVLACGVDVAYPRGHDALLARVAAEGLVISELPLGATPTRLRFLGRNRLIAALATGTVVVEAAWRSGSLNTANWAQCLGRAVMGVPGPADSTMSAGVHRLIRDGAVLVTGADEVLEATAPLGSSLLGWTRGPDRPFDRLPADQQRVLESLDHRRSLALDEVAASAGVDVLAASAALSVLLLQRQVERSGSGWRLAREARATLFGEHDAGGAAP